MRYSGFLPAGTGALQQGQAMRLNLYLLRFQELVLSLA
jgi:hypothetical protein